jgi:hypothetical protein
MEKRALFDKSHTAACNDDPILNGNALAEGT